MKLFHPPHCLQSDWLAAGDRFAVFRADEIIVVGIAAGHQLSRAQEQVKCLAHGALGRGEIIRSDQGEQLRALGQKLLDIHGLPIEHALQPGQGRVPVAGARVVVADMMGPALIASGAKKQFWGMRLAVHYGCHLLRPQPAVRWDDPLHPKKVEEIVAALGARVVDYTTKMQCCGGALDRVGQRESSLAFCRRKLNDLQDNQVDALIVVCPSCFQQFDLNQAALQRANENINVPVLYLSELIALAYGHTPEEIGLDMHRVSVQPFLDKWESRQADKAKLALNFDVALLNKCDSCRACKDDCPVCKIDPTFQPNDIIHQLVEGDLDQVIEDGQLWKCLECYTCLELCHSEIGMAETFRKLKEIAIERGVGPESVPQSYKMFMETGTLGKPKQSARKKLGLDPLPEDGGDAMSRIMGNSDKSEGAE